MKNQKLISTLIIISMLLTGIICIGAWYYLASEPGWCCAGSSTPCPECRKVREIQEVSDAR